MRFCFGSGPGESQEPVHPFPSSQSPGGGALLSFWETQPWEVQGVGSQVVPEGSLSSLQCTSSLGISSCSSQLCAGGLLHVAVCAGCWGYSNEWERPHDPVSSFLRWGQPLLPSRAGEKWNEVTACPNMSSIELILQNVLGETDFVFVYM